MGTAPQAPARGGGGGRGGVNPGLAALTPERRAEYDKKLEEMHRATDEEIQRYFEQYRRETARGAQKRLSAEARGPLK